MNTPQIELGMNVWACDGLLVGRVGRVWHPSGSISPPLPGVPGEPDMVAGTWGKDGNPGVLQVNRFQAPDWFIPFADVATVVDRDVYLSFTEKEAQQRGWNKKPVLLDEVSTMREKTIGPDVISEGRPAGHGGRIDPKIAAILLAEETDLWRAITARSKHTVPSSK
jgi:hypothetical protein